MNLIHMNGRVYDPVVGRFMSVDPVVNPGVSQDLNSYSYAWNIPLSVTDPSGWDEARTDLEQVEVTGRRWWLLLGLQEFLESLALGQLGRTPSPDTAFAEPPDTLEEIVVTGEKTEPLCKAIKNPLAVELGWTVDIQPPLLPGGGGGFGIGFTSNGQLFVSFTAQAELGEVFNFSTGPQLTIGRERSDYPVREATTQGFFGAQYAVGIGPVASGGWTRSESGNSFSRGVGKLGGGIAGQLAMVIGRNTRIAVNAPICR